MSEWRGDGSMNLRSAAISRRSILLGALGVTAMAALGPAATAVAAAGGPSQAPTTATHFSISIDGTEIASFRELVGITSEVEPIEYLQATGKEVIFKKLPGKTKPPTVTLKRSLSGGMALWTWHEAVRQGKIAAARKDCALVMYDTSWTAVARYHLVNAWPSKLEISGMKAGSSEIAYETVQLTCEGIQRVAV